MNIHSLKILLVICVIVYSVYFIWSTLFGVANLVTTESIGYPTEYSARENCSDGNVIPLYRSGYIVGYGCLHENQ